jgi:hypothetical protein
MPADDTTQQTAAARLRRAHFADAAVGSEITGRIDDLTEMTVDEGRRMWGEPLRTSRSRSMTSRSSVNASPTRIAGGGKDRRRATPGAGRRSGGRGLRYLAGRKKDNFSCSVPHSFTEAGSLRHLVVPLRIAQGCQQKESS